MNERAPEKPQETAIDKLFELTMKKKWKEVLAIYKTNPVPRKAKLTKSEETALHIAVSSYHADEHAEIVKQMVEAIPEAGAIRRINTR